MTPSSLISPQFLQQIREHVEGGCKLYLQTDVRELFDNMGSAVCDSGVLRIHSQVETQLPAEHRPLGGATASSAALRGMRAASLFGVPTQREASVLLRGGKVWRMICEFVE